MEYFGGQYIPSGKVPEYGHPKKKEVKEKKIGFMKHLMFWLVLIFFTLGFIITLSEVVLRIVPGQWSNTFFHIYDPVLGTWHISSHTGDYKREDFNTKGIEINSFGMRDRERTIAKTPGVLRIAVLGDSFTEAFHVANEQTFTRLLEESGQGKYEVLNFGVAGFGTVQELLTYRERVRAFQPDVVLLAFLPSNDMRNNNRALEDIYTGNSNTDRPFVERRGTSSWVIVPPEPKPSATNPILLFVKKNFTLYRFLWYSKGMLEARYASVDVASEASSQQSTTTPAATSSAPVAKSSAVYLAKLFAPPDDKDLRDAWEGTEWAIKQLHIETESDRAKLVLAVLPDATPLELDAKQALEKEYGEVLPKNFDIDYPAKRLKEYSKKQNIPFIDLTVGFRLERDRMNLTRPYFSYEHDGHWAPKGHVLAAQLIREFLVKNKLIP